MIYGGVVWSTWNNMPGIYQEVWDTCSSPRTRLLWSKSSSLWLYFYLKLLIAPLSNIPLFTPSLKTASGLIPPGYPSIRLRPLELRYYIPSPTRHLSDNAILPFYYDDYGLELLPATVSPTGLLVLIEGLTNENHNLRCFPGWTFFRSLVYNHCLQGRCSRGNMVSHVFLWT